MTSRKQRMKRLVREAAGLARRKVVANVEPAGPRDAAVVATDKQTGERITVPATLMKDVRP